MSDQNEHLLSPPLPRPAGTMTGEATLTPAPPVVAGGCGRRASEVVTAGIVVGACVVIGLIVVLVDCVL